jgi:coatomer protein complex subunit alpha (xenin)
VQAVHLRGNREDLELPAEALALEPAAGASVPFAAPTPGVPASARWLQKCGLAAEHAAAGDFASAMRLLERQLGIVNFEPLRPYFLELHAGAAASLPLIPGVPPISAPLDRNWHGDAGATPPAAPALVYSLVGLEEGLKKAYRSVTEGKFGDALSRFNGLLHLIPLLVVDTRKEVDDVKELLSIAKEYNIALRIELKRKELGASDAARAAELAAYFTHAKLQPVHQALSLRSAMSIFFKLKNHATCATFCRRLLELNPGQKMAQQARQVLAACEKAPTDAVAVNYDPRNPFDVCSLTFTPIYRGNKFVEDPYTGARFQPSCAGQVSPVGDLARIGADVSGLLCSPTQLR